MAEFRVGGLLFTSKFDSGNLARVEKVSKDEEEEGLCINVYENINNVNENYCIYSSKDLSIFISLVIV